MPEEIIKRVAISISMVEFKESPSLLTLIKLENDLSEILGVKDDLVTTGSFEKQEN